MDHTLPHYHWGEHIRLGKIYPQGAFFHGTTAIHRQPRGKHCIYADSVWPAQSCGCYVVHFGCVGEYCMVHGSRLAAQPHRRTAVCPLPLMGKPGFDITNKHHPQELVLAAM